MLVTEYLGIPFLPTGRTREGVDCWGFICMLYLDKLGITLTSFSNIDGKEGAIVAAAVLQESQENWLEVKDRREFDVVVLRIKGLPWHVGVVMDNKTFIHADPVKGICVERFDSIHWKNRVLGYYRLAELNDN